MSSAPSSSSGHSAQAQPALDLSLAEKYFHISPSGSDDPVYSTPAADLLRPETMDDLLRRGRDMLNGLGLDIAVSFVGLAFFGIPAAVHTYMWLYGRVLDLSIDNLTVQLERHGDHPHLILNINEVRWSPLPEQGRDDAVVQELTRLFRRTVNPVVEFAAARGGFKPDLIWNQFGARMVTVSDFVIQFAPDEEARQNYRKHLELLVDGLGPEVFNRRKNPYVHEPVYVESPYDPDKKVIVRSSCCMWYRRENGVKCYTCPILNDAKREEMKLKLREKSRERAK
ncbi:(2Fe-2S)-binding protein [Paenibacillus sp. GYB003]|uniref:(2Fe-2S)-binding protein n=1 Tax=Paenibacillus sp. GYB003 TaxID=2994392 RepID=UPI002F9669A0